MPSCSARSEPLMWRLVPTLVREMGQAYPGAAARRGADHRDAQARGDALPQDAGARPRDPRRARPRALKQGDKLKGETAFTLYDTYGFPLDLTQDALRARGIGVDTDALQRRDGAAAAKARASWAGSGEAATETVWFALREQRRRHRVPRLRHRSRRRRRSRRWSRDGKEVDELNAGETGAVVVNQTPFYGEVGRAGRRHRR